MTVGARRPRMTRRAALGGAGGLAFAACAGVARDEPQIIAIERNLGGRIGVAALDLSTRRRITHRADERFAMCSTFKWALAGLILADAERRALALADPVAISENDVVFHSPVVEKRVGDGAMTVGALCAAAVTASDNAAANLLLRLVDGPAGFTERLRALGDRTTRLDRIEPELNENAPGDPRDTTTPTAMLALLQKFLIGDALTDASQTRLAGWMIASKTGLQRLRAGFPQDWAAGDKTGTSGNGAFNDVAFAAPSGRKPIFVAAYVNAPGADADAANDAHREIGRFVAAAFA